MQDPRALANTRNLESWRAWRREGFRRSGFGPISLIVPLLAPPFVLAPALFGHAARDARGWVILMAVALALYLAAGLGLSVFAALRLNAWKRAHPWSPPPHPGGAPEARPIRHGELGRRGASR